MNALKRYFEERGAVPASAEAIRVYNERIEIVLPKIEAALKAQRRAAHFALLGIPDPRKGKS